MALEQLDQCASDEQHNITVSLIPSSGVAVRTQCKVPAILYIVPYSAGSIFTPFLQKLLYKI